MPNAMMSADSALPRRRGNETTEERLERLENALVQLTESMRYLFNNLDAENFNDTGLKEIGGIITKPILLQITDKEGNFTVLTLQSDGLHIGNAEGSTTIDGSSITAGSITADQIKSNELVVGGKVSMGNGAVVSWDNLQSDAKTEVTNAQNAAANAAGAAAAAGSAATGVSNDLEVLKTNIGYTKLGQNYVISPYIKGGTIEGTHFVNDNGGVPTIPGLEIAQGLVNFRYDETTIGTLGTQTATGHIFMSTYSTHGIILECGGSGKIELYAPLVVSCYGTTAPGTNTPGYGTPGALYFQI